MFVKELARRQPYLPIVLDFLRQYHDFFWMLKKADRKAFDCLISCVLDTLPHEVKTYIQPSIN